MDKPLYELRSLHYTEAEGKWEMTSQDYRSKMATSGKLDDTDFAGFCMRLFANGLVSKIEFPILIERNFVKMKWCWRVFKKASHSHRMLFRIDTMAELKEYIDLYGGNNSFHVVWSQNHVEFSDLIEKTKIFEKEHRYLELIRSKE